MKNQKTVKLVMAALLAALVCVATVVLVIPLPGNGFANLGDGMVILCGALLGPWWGAAAAAVGAALGDLVLGYGVYAPATFVIKGGMALAVFALFRKLRAPAWLRIPLTVVVSEVIMVGGYFLFELALYGPTVAVPDLVGNGMQGLVGAVLGAILLSILSSNRRLAAFLQR